MVGRVGIEPTTPGLKVVGSPFCSMLLDMILAHAVKATVAVLYLWCRLVITRCKASVS